MRSVHKSDCRSLLTLSRKAEGGPWWVDLAFGPYAKYGQTIKDYRNADQPGRYAPPEMVGTERKGIFGIREDEERSICTSHAERHNLTIRTPMKRFTRLSLGFDNVRVLAHK